MPPRSCVSSSVAQSPPLSLLLPPTVARPVKLSDHDTGAEEIVENARGGREQTEPGARSVLVGLLRTLRAGLWLS